MTTMPHEEPAVRHGPSWVDARDLSTLITSAALAALYFVDRRRRSRAKAAEPAIPSSTAGPAN